MKSKYRLNEILDTSNFLQESYKKEQKWSKSTFEARQGHGHGQEDEWEVHFFWKPPSFSPAPREDNKWSGGCAWEARYKLLTMDTWFSVLIATSIYPKLGSDNQQTSTLMKKLLINHERKYFYNLIATHTPAVKSYIGDLSVISILSWLSERYF